MTVGESVLGTPALTPSSYSPKLTTSAKFASMATRERHSTPKGRIEQSPSGYPDAQRQIHALVPGCWESGSDQTTLINQRKTDGISCPHGDYRDGQKRLFHFSEISRAEGHREQFSETGGNDAVLSVEDNDHIAIDRLELVQHLTTGSTG